MRGPMDKDLNNTEPCNIKNILISTKSVKFKKRIKIKKTYEKYRNKKNRKRKF